MKVTRMSHLQVDKSVRIPFTKKLQLAFLEIR